MDGMILQRKKISGKVVPPRKQEIKSNNVKHQSASGSVQESIHSFEEASNPIRKRDIVQTVANADDQKYYKDFRRWRYCFCEDGLDRSDIGSLNGGNWISYFRLNKRQKEIVDIKMAPQINRALWSKWPGSTIEWQLSLES